MDHLTWDKEQLEVINADPSAHLLVEAGPGMGKTAVACARVANLLNQGIEPANIWLVSFTRTAVKEIRERINQLVNEQQYAAAVRISTLDSHSWYLRQGFDYAEADELFGGYESNIIQIIHFLQNKHEGLLEYLSTMQHLIVDEAQDFVGNRNQLIYELINNLPEACGITIFTDSAQAIYGFADIDTYRTEPLKTRLLKDQGLFFSEISLKTVHRSESNSLKTIFTDVRDFVLDNSVNGKDKYDIVLDSIKECADDNLFSLSIDRFNDSSLILFRRQAEVFLYSQYLSKNNIQHKIRAGGASPMLSMWIGVIFGCYSRKTMDRHEFDRLWNKKIGKEQKTEGVEINKAWNILISLSGDRRGRLNVDQLKKIISRHQPPIELSIQEAGNNGPILSTIHASKGREADYVYIANSKIINNKPDLINEETRVLFVAATRAKKHLYFFNAINDDSCISSKRDTRKINLNKSKNQMYSAEIELRPDVDFDYLSFVKTNNNGPGLIKSIYTQIMLRGWLSEIRKVEFIKKGNNFEPYTIFLILNNNVHIRLGKCSLDLNDRLIQTVKEIVGYAEQITLPRKIRTMCIGGRTVTISGYEQEIPVSPYGTNGIFVFPVFSNFFEFDIKLTNLHHIDQDDEIYQDEDIYNEDDILPELDLTLEGLAVDE